MNIQRKLRDKLESFLRKKTQADLVPTEEAVLWPPDLQPFTDCFSGYTWGRALNQTTARVYGIHALGYRPPYNLSQIEPLIFHPNAGANDWYALRSVDLEYYLIVEMFNAKFARVSLAMLSTATGWHILEEHILQRPQPLTHLGNLSKNRRAR